jgi:hypothetical protein
MAEESLPPSPNFTGIDFNPAFFPNASSEFLNFPVAQGTETFSKLFATEIDTASPSTTFDFLTSQTENINIGTSVGASKTIILGQATGTSVHAGSIDFKGTHINNNVSATTGDISLANNQTTGILNIGTGSRTGAGAINIGTAGTGLFNINVGTTNQSTTTVNNVLVGSNGCIAGRSTYLTYNATTAIPATINLDVLVLFFGSTASQTLTLPLGVASQRMYIKNYASVDVTISGGVMVLWGLTTVSSTLLLKSGESTLLVYNISGWVQATPTNAFGTLDAPKVDTAMTLGSNLTTGDLTIAGAQTTGDINIGNGSARLAGGAINIGAGTTAANPITIGGASSAVTVGGTLAVTGTLTANNGIVLPSGDTLTLTGNINGAGNITTTGSGTITSAGTLTASSGITSNGAITLPTTTYTPGTTQLGYMANTAGTLGGNISLTTTAVPVLRVSNLAIGLYIVTVTLSVNSASSSTETLNPTLTTNTNITNFIEYARFAGPTTTGSANRCVGTFSGGIRVTSATNVYEVSLATINATANFLEGAFVYTKIG